MFYPSLRSLLCIPFIAGVAIGSQGCGETDGSPQSVPEIPQAMVTVSIPDVQTSRAHLDHGIFGRLRQLPELKPFFAQIEEGMQESDPDTGLSAALVLNAMGGAYLQLESLSINAETDEPQFHGFMTFESNDASDAIWTTISAELPSTDAPTGSSAALSIPHSHGVTIARNADSITLASADQSHQSTIPAQHKGPYDFRLTWNADAAAGILSSFADQIRDVDPTTALMFANLQNVANSIGNGEMKLEFLPDGFRESLYTTVDGRKNGSMAVDSSVIDRVPHNALMMVAVGINGPVLWEQTQKQAAALPHEGGDDPMAALDAILPFPLETLYTNLHGTATIAVLPPAAGAPFPGLAMQLPGTANVQEILDPFLVEFGITTPAIGEQTTIPLPIPVPVQVVIARSASHLLVTTVPSHATAWLADSIGNGATSNPAYTHALSQKAQGELVMIGYSNTPEILTLAQTYIDSYGSMMPAQSLGITQAIMSVFKEHQSTGYLYGTASEAGSFTQSKGLVGSWVTAPIVAGMVLPAITSARGKARSLEEMNNLKQISMALFMYQDTYSSIPTPPDGIAVPTDPRAHTAAIFEHLALDMDLPAQLFFRNAHNAPAVSVRNDIPAIWREPNLDFARDFAYDWSAPITSPATRAVLAGRWPNADGKGAVVFGDHSVSPLDVYELNDDGSIRVLINPKVNGHDNIFAPDDVDPERYNIPNRGDRSKAFVR